MHRLLSTLSLLLSAVPAVSQSVATSQGAWCANVVLPQARVFHLHPGAPALHVTGVRADILIVDGVATTTLDVSLVNQGDRDAEGELLLPVPDGAVVSGFDFEGKGATSSARLLPRDEARAAYDNIVAELRDPALLEFHGAALIRSSVFPVPKGGTQTVRVRYEHILPESGGRLDYELPRSESLALAVPWEVTLEVRSQRPIADVYSPTHDLPRVSGHANRVKLAARTGGSLQAGSLRVAVLLASGPLSTTLFTSADPDGPGGWFLLLAGLGEVPPEASLPPREVTLVLDRSGSMAGEKFEQARAAALQILEGLAFGEAVQIIDYSKSVERFAPGPVVKTKENLPALRAYLEQLSIGGGTNLDGALAAALHQPTLTGMLPVVLFLTDGLPTEGETRESEIRSRIERENVHQRRVFTFGVGHDVNAPLLDAVAVQSRARATYVQPGVDVERAVADVFEDLAGPVVTDLSVRVTDCEGVENSRLVRDLHPQLLPDLFRGDRLVLVGRYLEAVPMRFEVQGTRGAAPATWTLQHDFAQAAVNNRFVPRLWAMRRIAQLEDELRRAGADATALATLKDDARFGELVREMLDLAARFGVLTDSTAFLALEGTELGQGQALVADAASRGLYNATCRTGVEGIAAQQNVALNREQTWVNSCNTLYQADGSVAANNTVQTIQGRTFFRRGTRWIDGRAALAATLPDPDREVTFGSEAYRALVSALTQEGCVGQLALDGDILLMHGSETVLIKAPAKE